MSDFHLVDPQGWEYDLQSIYSAFIGHFQLYGTPWHDRTWGQFFETFEQFLAFSWPVISVTDTRTGRAHIVTRMSSVQAFLKMIKSRFGETLPQVDNILLVSPFETSHRHLRHVNDGPSYKKLHAALPAVALAAYKARVRAGDPNAIRQLWASRDKTFLALDFECVDGHVRSCIEWGYAAIRSSHLVAAGAWPPVPDTNYRKGHYVISEFAEIVGRTSSPASQYAFGDTHVIPKAKLPRIIQSVLSSLVSPDSESAANTVVLVAHGVQVVMHYLEEMKIRLPTNVLAVDTAYFERALYTTGDRGPMSDCRTGQPRVPEGLLSLGALLRSFGIMPPCVMGNSGNDALMTLVAFQRMVDPRGGVSVDASGMGMGMRNGPVNEKEDGKDEKLARRTSTLRFLRPLSIIYPVADADPKYSTTGPTDRAQKRRSRQSTLEPVDEMGVLPTSMKRASTFSALQSPVVYPDADVKHVDVSHKRVSRHGGMDEKNAMPPSMKRASMFSALRSPVVHPDADVKHVDVSHKRVSRHNSVDQMGAMPTSMKRSSMFSSLRAPLLNFDEDPKQGATGNGDVSLKRHSRHSGVDEMGAVPTSVKRSSMFSALRSPLMGSSDKHKKGVSQGSVSMSGSGPGWMSPSTIAPGQRRHSTLVERHR